jgi:hypothetical protein|tara:strand:- start:140 stop:373 length:234 start_codon:yes stop_codon:yes gene_type:complete
MVVVYKMIQVMNIDLKEFSIFVFTGRRFLTFLLKDRLSDLFTRWFHLFFNGFTSLTKRSRTIQKAIVAPEQGLHKRF